MALVVLSFGATDLRMSRAWWQANWSGEVAELLGLIAETSEGRALILRAKKSDPQFDRLIQVGETSITESVYQRSYSILDGKEQFRIQNSIRLGRNSSRADAALDLAHELTHFIDRRPLNPYDLELNAVDFIRHGIEGEGGELDALEAECKIGWQLEAKFAALPASENCVKYRRRDDYFDRAFARRDFYRVGSWLSELKSITEGIPEISEELVVFRSSHTKQPYPVALKQEFEQTVATACENNRRKAIAIREQSGRSLASVSASKKLRAELEKLQRFQDVQCRTNSVTNNDSIVTK